MGSNRVALGNSPVLSTALPIAGSAVGTAVGGPIGAVAGNVIGRQAASSIETGQYPGINEPGPLGTPALLSPFGIGDNTGSGGVGSIFSGIFGGGSGGGGNAGSASGNSGTIQGLSALSNAQTGLGNQLVDQGNTLFGPAFNQVNAGTGLFNAGVSGQLTPAQQALLTQNLGTQDASTYGTYGNLGMGGSTPQGQDIAGNDLRSMAETANINDLTARLGLAGEQVGYQGTGQALGYYGGGDTAFGGASTDLARAGGLQDFNTEQLNAAINSLGNKSQSGLGGGLSNIIGGATGTSGTGSFLGSLFGGGGGGAAGDLSNSGMFFDQAGNLVSDVATF